jgi:hypothetical protein
MTLTNGHARNACSRHSAQSLPLRSPVSGRLWPEKPKPTLETQKLTQDALLALAAISPDALASSWPSVPRFCPAGDMSARLWTIGGRTARRIFGGPALALAEHVILALFRYPVALPLGSKILPLRNLGIRYPDTTHAWWRETVHNLYLTES